MPLICYLIRLNCFRYTPAVGHYWTISVVTAYRNYTTRSDMIYWFYRNIKQYTRSTSYQNFITGMRPSPLPTLPRMDRLLELVLLWVTASSRDFRSKIYGSKWECIRYLLYYSKGGLRMGKKPKTKIKNFEGAYRRWMGRQGGGATNYFVFTRLH